MQFAKGFIGARWAASDPNGDPLVYTVEIRGENENRVEDCCKDKVREKYLSWDSTAFPDGEYRLARDRVGRARQSAGRRR